MSAVGLYAYAQLTKNSLNKDVQNQGKIKKLDYVNGDISIDKFYREEELNKLNKFDLTVIYLGKDKLSGRNDSIFSSPFSTWSYFI